MRQYVILIAAICLPHALHAQSRSGDPRLKGIVDFPGLRRAILEVPTPLRFGPEQLLMAVGEDIYGLDVVWIHPEEGKAQIHFHGETRVLSLSEQIDPTRNEFPGIVLEGAGIVPVIRLYGKLLQRTILQFHSLPIQTLSLRTSATNLAHAAVALDQALAKQGLMSLPDGEKFLLLVPKSQARIAKPPSPKAGAPANAPPQTEVIGPGLIDFSGVDVNQVLMIYTQYLGKKLDPSQPLLQAVCQPVFLLTETSLMREEVIYAFETLLGWQNIKLVPSADGTVKAVAVSE